jgi:hypothetical protein
MAILTAILTHLDARSVRAHLDYLGQVAPESHFVICYGGSREEFERLDGLDALFIDDPTLRVPHHDRSYLGLFRSLYDGRVRDDPGAELIYLIEYDQLILKADFEARLTELADRSDAGLFAKSASPRNDTNWPHFTRNRGDERFAEFIKRISKRDDPARRYGCLGTGMLFRREALEALASTDDAPPVYWELIVPTLVYHLGFDLADVDAYGDLYATVRWRPEYTVEEVIAAKRGGASLVHPFKELDALDAVREA